MDLLFEYNQEKKNSKIFNSTACLKVLEDKNKITYIGEFYFEFNNNVKLKVNHKLELDVVTSDFIVTIVHTTNGNIVEKTKKNNFKTLETLLEYGLIRGERIESYWGPQYKNATNIISTIFYNKVKDKFNNNYYNNSLFKNKSTHCLMYRLIVNYFLDKRNIKSHDGIYFTIQNDFPSKKWLNKNDNNFLPALLDSYGIKSKYLIKEININNNTNFDLKVLKYVCNLFGSNYLDYIKNFDWKECTKNSFTCTKKHVITTEYEKKALVKVINEFSQKDNTDKTIIQLIYKFLSNKDDVLKMDLNINFKFNNIDSFYKIHDNINGILKHKKRGYRVRYVFQSEFVKTIEDPIIIDNLTYIPKILLTEEDFIIEGHQMRNCMGSQFLQGIIFIYISLKSIHGTINLQFKNGRLIQERSKANSNVPETYRGAINILTDRMLKNKDIIWVKENFDII